MLRVLKAFVHLLVLVPLAVGCGDHSTSPGGGTVEFLNIGSAPTGGTFFVMGGAFEKVLNQERGKYGWREVTNQSTKGSRENIIRLDSGELHLGLSNAAITYFAVRGGGAFKKKYDVRSVMTLAPNVAQFVTVKGSGVKTLSDLKGRRVFVGPAGAGFQMFLEPILKAHGLSYKDLTPVNGKFSDATGFLQDGSVAAAFLGGAIPTPAISQLASQREIWLVPYDKAAKKKLLADYPFFGPASIPAGTYKGQDDAFDGLNVGFMQLLTSAKVDDDTVYNVTKALYENRQKVVEVHKAGKAINPKNVIRQTGTPFHPGAIRYYEEIKIWPAGEGQ